MKKIFFVGLFIVYCLLAGSLAFRFTKALFADTVKSTNNTPTTTHTFLTEAITPTITPAGTSLASHIVISEVSPIGGSTLEWIKLFNPTKTSVNVSGWKIQDNRGTDTLPSTPMIPAYGSAVVVASGSSVIVPNTDIKITLDKATIDKDLAAGGDHVILKDTSNREIDQMSFGSDTTVFTLAEPKKSQSLSRNQPDLDTQTVNDWQVSTKTLGVTN